MEESETCLPYRAEYAKSARSACQSCKDKIEKDHLRLAVLVQSPVHDGKITKWYHYACFFLKQRPKSVGDISHFESLRWEDQENIRKKVESCAGKSKSASKSSGKASATKRKSETTTSSGEFKIEYSVSNRAKCRACGEKIIKKDVRACKVDRESDEGRRYGGVPLWHHLDCFKEVRQDLEFYSAGEELPGFKKLKDEDKLKVKETLPAIKSVKKEEPDEQPTKKSKVDDQSEIVKNQNRQMFKYRDLLKKLPKKDLIELLEKNHQEVPSGTERILDRLCDQLAFGALVRCSTCKQGQLVFRSGLGYQCLGEDEWAKCQKLFDDPPRKAFKIPKKLKEEYDFLAAYKCKIQKRIFDKSVASTSTASTSSSSIASSKSGPTLEKKLPLKGMTLSIVGKFEKEQKEKLKHRIEKLGGAAKATVDEATTAVISTPEMIEKNGAYIKSAKNHNIQIVPESFLDECEKGCDAIGAINRLNLTDWGSDPSTRMATIVKSGAKSMSFASKYKSTLGPVKVQIQNGIAVDPQSELGSLAHVYRDPVGNIYNASLAISDIQTGKNSYYKLQVLEANSKNAYWLFRSWGRIGTTIGGIKEESLTRDEAISQFKQLFTDKTANSWDDRKNFRKQPGKMVMVDVAYDDDEVDSTIPDVSSKLEKPVQDIIKLIFNIDIMKNVMKEMEIDLQKMPLGNLSKKHIQQAYQVLTTLQNNISKEGKPIDDAALIRYTNQFFSLIPHDYGVDQPPLLRDLDLIKQKTEMLDSLMEIEIAYSLLRTSDEGDARTSKIDSHYRKLKTNMRPLPKSDTEFETLKLYVKNTHAETHRNYELEVVEIFKVDRHGESERYSSFEKLHNRKLLWHGSRITNFVGILSQGLRIAPPEAPVTGYMFGKGIYFADMVSKSANYCMAGPSNNTGLLLLCEVALGDMHELYAAENIVKPPKGKHSVKGIGKTHPNPKITKTLEDGVEIPLGPGVPSPHKNTSLLYNEYIVYDVAQVKVRYLVQVKFNFNY